MKILLVQDADWKQKGPHPQHHLMEKLSQRGHKIVVIGYNQLWNKNNDGHIISAHRIVEDYSRVYECKGVDYYQIGFLKIPILDYISYSITSSLEIRRIINNYRPDIIISVTSLISSLWAVHNANIQNIPFVYYWTDVIHELLPINLFKPLGIVVEKYVLTHSTMTLFMNDLLGNVIDSLVPNLSMKKLLPGGVDTRHFRPIQNPTSMMKQYNIEHSDIVFLFMGWIYNDSGLDKVILSISKLHQSRVKLFIVGDGPGVVMLRNLTESINVSSQVIFTGQKPYSELPCIMSVADYFILPTPVTNLTKNIVPIKIFEYLSMKRPVIATKLPGVMKEFGNDSGLTYVESASEIILEGIEISESRKIWQINNASRFITKYSWDYITDMFESMLYSSINNNDVMVLK